MKVRRTQWGGMWIEWDIGTCMVVTVIGEKRALHERTREITQGWRDETCGGDNIEK